MNKLSLRVTLLLNLYWAPALVNGAENIDYSSAYFNVGAGVGTIANLPTGSAAASIAAGYRFNRYLSLDAQWTILPSSQWGWYDSYNLYTMNLGGILPVTDNWNFYGKLGSGLGYSAWTGTLDSPSVYNAPGSASTWVGQITAGTSLTVSDHFNLYLENSTWLPFTSQPGSFGTTNATFLGFQYNFSAPRAATAVNQSSSPAMTATSSAATEIVIKPTTPLSNSAMVAAPLPAAGVIAPPPAVSASAAAVSTSAVAASSLGNSQPVKPVRVAPVESDGVIVVTPMTTPAELKQRTIAAANGRHYIVIRPGDTLYRIALLSGVSEARLKQLNKLNSNAVSLGRKFYLD